MSGWKFVLSWVEHEKSFIISRPGLLALSIVNQIDNVTSMEWELGQNFEAESSHILM